MKRKIIGIYSIRNLINGRNYIGQSDDIFKRWNQHLISLRTGKSKSKIQKDWNEHGEEKFEFSILEETSYNQYELDSRESFYAYKFNVWENGYNTKKLLNYQCLEKEQIAIMKKELLSRFAKAQDGLYRFFDVCERLGWTTEELAIIFKNISETEMKDCGVFLELEIAYSYKTSYSTIEKMSWAKHLDYLIEIEKIYLSL